MFRTFRPALRALAAAGSAFAALLIAGALPVHARVPAGYAATCQAVIDGAKKVGKVIVYTPTDANAGRPLVREFESLYPGMKSSTTT